MLEVDGIRGLLLLDATLIPLVATRIYPVKLPQRPQKEPVYPALSES